MSATNASPATSGINSDGRKVFLPLGKPSPLSPAHPTHVPFYDTTTPSNHPKPFAENNPSILNPLAHALGLSHAYAFHDLYSFSDADLLAVVPRPALALLFVYPHTETAQAWIADEVAAEKAFEEVGDEPVLWFRQIVVNGEFVLSNLCLLGLFDYLLRCYVGLASSECCLNRLHGRMANPNWR